MLNLLVTVVSNGPSPARGDACVFLFGFEREKNAAKGKVSGRLMLHKYEIEE